MYVCCESDIITIIILEVNPALFFLEKIGLGKPDNLFCFSYNLFIFILKVMSMNRHHFVFITGIVVLGLIAGQLQRTPGGILAGFADLASRLTNHEWTLVITGDVIPARSVNYQMTTRSDFTWPISNIAPLLSNSDLTLINLEAPLVKNCPVTTQGMIFCGDQKFIQGLKFSGVDVVNLSNNHIRNYGWDGVLQTENLLIQNNILTTGLTTTGSCANKPYFCSKKTVKKIDDITVGFLGYTIVGVSADQNLLVSDIGSFDDEVDVLVVSFHWGAEYTRSPVGAPDDPRDIAHLAVDNGADLVVGNHPHWIQGLEDYKGAKIFYALGNTIFDQEWSTETKTGIIAKLTFSDSDFKDIEIFPLRLQDYGKAVLLEGVEKQGVLDIFTTASESLKN